MSNIADPIVGVSVVTTWPSTLEEDIVNYASAGADGIGIWEFKLRDRSDSDFALMVQDAGLAVGICGPAVPSILPDPFFAAPIDPKERTSALCASIERFATFTPAAVLCVTGDVTNLDERDARNTTVRGIREAARCAADNGVLLAVEPQRPDQHPVVASLADSLIFLEEIGEPNVKVLADVYHFWDSPTGYRELEDCVGSGRLCALQLNDYRNPTRGPLDRLLPGDGVIDIPRIFTIAANAGFHGWIDIEVFSDNGTFGNSYPDSLWDRDPAQIVGRAVRNVRELWRARSE
jgi:sugar phosphate isomerase/epimerase